MVVGSDVGRRPRLGHVAPLVAAAAVVASTLFLWQGRWLVGLASAWLALLALMWRSPSRRATFAILTVILSTAGTLTFVAGLDLYFHHRFARNGGYNVWGYRGEAVGRKQAGERRVVYLGGSAAFGYGVSSDQTIPYYLQQELNRQPPRTDAPDVTVVNLGWNSEGAYSMRFTLGDYEYLQSDVAVLYSGYNDLLGFNNLVFRRESAVFRLTGYLPILPIIPLNTWRRINNLGDTARGKVVFQPGLADRYATEAADTALRISQALERQLGKLSPGAGRAPIAGTRARDDWRFYLAQVREAVNVALAQGQQVIVATEPYIADHHVQQQQELARMLATEFGGQPRVHYVNAGRAVDLRDRALSFDGMHLSADGNRRVAAFLAPEIAKVLR